MKNTIFLVAMACLLAGCAGKGQTLMKIKTEANVTSEEGLPVKIRAQDEKPLPIKIVPDEIVIGAFAACLIAVCATSLAAIAAWRAADSAKRAAEEQLKILKKNLKK
jgi:ABC-type lipoprotein release transport system permease subunit